MITLKLQIQAAGGGGAFVEVPDEVVEKLGGGKKRVKVRATFDGLPYRGSVAPYAGHVMLGILKSIREELGKQIGDTVTVTLEPDAEERKVEVPKELAAALKGAGLRAKFDELSFSNRKEYAAWIAGAKTEATREKRLAAAVEKIGQGKKNPSEK